MSLSGQSSRFCDPCFCVRYPPTFDHAAGSQDVCQDSQQAHADRWRRLPPRSPPGTRLTGRSRPERTAHHGIKKRAPAHSRRSFKRKNGRFWRAQFCSEMARHFVELAGTGQFFPPLCRDQVTAARRCMAGRLCPRASRLAPQLVLRPHFSVARTTSLARWANTPDKIKRMIFPAFVQRFAHC